MSRHNPPVFGTIRDDKWPHSQRLFKLFVHTVPQIAQLTRFNHIVKISARSFHNTGISIKLAIGEPKAVIGSCIKPTGIMAFRPFPQNIGGGPQIRCHPVQKSFQIICPRVESGRTCLQRSVKTIQRWNCRAVTTGCGLQIGRASCRERV